MRFSPVMITILAFGCATTPKPVIDAGVMQLQALNTIEANTNATIAGYAQQVKDDSAYYYAQWLDSVTAQMTDDAGNINLARFKAAALSASANQAQQEAAVDAKTKAIQDALAYQFAAARNLSTLVQQYNAETGMSPETFQALMLEGRRLAESIAAQRADEVTKPDATGQPTTDWQAVFDIMRKANEQRNTGTLNLGALFGGR